MISYHIERRLLTEGWFAAKGGKMGIAGNLNAKILRPYNSKNADTAQHILNKKANAKLNFIASVFERALSGHWSTLEDGFLYKKIALKNLRHLDELTISYYLQNRFFARIYDLKFDIDIPLQTQREEETRFELAYSGVTQITGAEFKLAVGSKEDLVVLNRLNSELITKRLVKLDFLDFKIVCLPNEKSWHISADSIIGSATWNLLPPMFQVVKPTDGECVLMIELFQLVTDAIIND